jgi:hypothetical protein
MLPIKPYHGVHAQLCLQGSGAAADLLAMHARCCTHSYHVTPEAVVWSGGETSTEQAAAIVLRFIVLCLDVMHTAIAELWPCGQS